MSRSTADVFGIGELQYIDFVRGWADGLAKLLETLKRQRVPFEKVGFQINPSWELYRRRKVTPIKNEPERLTSNWLRIAETPNSIRCFEPTGAVDRFSMWCACEASRHPMQPHLNGFFSFATLSEINDGFASFGKIAVKHEVDLTAFVNSIECAIGKQDASNLIHSMFRQAWNRFCRDRGTP